MKTTSGKNNLASGSSSTASSSSTSQLVEMPLAGGDLLDEALGEVWANFGATLREHQVAANWVSLLFSASDQKCDKANSNYAVSRLDPQGEDESVADAAQTNYERTQTYQMFYASAECLDSAKGVFKLIGDIDNDDKAAERLLKLLPDRATAIDFGCNTAFNLIRLLTKAEKVCGIEYSEDSVNKALVNLQRASAGLSVTYDVRRGSITDPLPDEFRGAAHGAMFTAVAQHIEPAELDKVFENIAVCLKLGGYSWVSWKDLPSNAELADMGLSALVGRTFTADQALADARAQVESSAELETIVTTLEQRCAGNRAPVHAVVFDVDYFIGRESVLAKMSQVKGDHNRPFWFYSFEDIASRAAKYGLKVEVRRCYLDAKRPYGVFHNEVIFVK